MLTRIVFLAVLPIMLAACSVLEEMRNPVGPEEPRKAEGTDPPVVPEAPEEEEVVEEEEFVPPTPEEALQALGDLGVPYSQRSFIDHAAQGDLEVVRLFVWAGMDVNVQPYTARVVLVPDRSNPTRLAHLESSWFPQEEEDNDTALMKAAGNGDLDVVEFLLESGADREIENQQGQNALAFAAAFGHLEVVKFLMDWTNICVDACEMSRERCRRTCGTAGQYVNSGFGWNSLSHGPRTPIQWAGYNGHLDVVQYLHPLIPYSWFPNTAFSTAVLGGHLDIVNWFIEDVFDDDVYIGRSMMIAAYMNHVDIVRRLLELPEVDIHWRMSDWIGIDTPEGYLHFQDIGFGPFHAAVQGDSPESLRILLMYWMLTFGADGADEHGETALMFAAAGGDLDMARTLIDNGAPVNARSDIGETALMFAARWGRADVVNMLLEEGADASLVNAYNETALLLAEENGHQDVVALLQ